MLVGNNVSLVIYGLLIAQSLKPLLATIENDFFIILVQIIIATTVVLITGEFLPKTIFRINPNLWLKIFSFLLFVFYVLLYPISGFSSWLSLKFMKLAGVGAQTDAQENVFSRIDLNYLIQESFDNNENEEEIETEISNRKILC